jgi:hypothetical protein
MSFGSRKSDQLRAQTQLGKRNISGLFKPMTEDVAVTSLGGYAIEGETHIVVVPIPMKPRPPMVTTR